MPFKILLEKCLKSNPIMKNAMKIDKNLIQITENVITSSTNCDYNCRDNFIDSDWENMRIEKIHRENGNRDKMAPAQTPSLLCQQNGSLDREGNRNGSN